MAIDVTRDELKSMFLESEERLSKRILESEERLNKRIDDSDGRLIIRIQDSADGVVRRLNRLFNEDLLGESKRIDKLEAHAKRTDRRLGKIEKHIQAS